MNMIGTCLIEQQIYKIKSKVKSTIAQTSLFDYLNKTFTCLLDYPFNFESTRIQKDNLKSLGSLLQLEEVQSLFEILGYTEENDHLIYTICDENLKKLESCLKILKESSHRSFDEQQQMESQGSTEEPEGVKQRFSCEVNLKQTSSKHLKDLLLSRHLKKEQESHARSLYSRKCSDTFNSNGYFSTQKTRQNKAFLLQKVFDNMDFNCKKTNLRAQK